VAANKSPAGFEPDPQTRSAPVLSASHKEALATGRDEGRAVRRYLEALEAGQTRRGRRRTVQSIEMRLQQIETFIGRADPVSRVHMIQERINLREELEAAETPDELGALEAEFVRTAANYARRRGVGWAAWRAAGVSPAVLRAAGIRRAATPRS
jgi:hypothetical protein